jgi:hypothetical protein
MMQVGPTALSTCRLGFVPATITCSWKWILAMATDITSKTKLGRWYVPLLRLFYMMSMGTVHIYVIQKQANRGHLWKGKQNRGLYLKTKYVRNQFRSLVS